MNPKALASQVGSTIRAWRTKAGLTMSELSELAGIDQGFLAYIENGKKMPSLVTAAKIAAGLKISLSDLFAAAGRPPLPAADYEIDRHLHSLFRDRTPAQRKDLTAVLRGLHNPDKVRALRKIIKR